MVRDAITFNADIIIKIHLWYVYYISSYFLNILEFKVFDIITITVKVYEFLALYTV